MFSVTFVLLICTIAEKVVCDNSLEFPSCFKFGASSSAYQVEGGWNASDKSISTWDQFVRKPGVTKDGSTGDVACDSYHLWRRDIQIAKELGLHFYRFSISWPRLLPSGLPDHISEDGKRYYSNLIDGLLEAGIEPLVTIYHLDLPMRFENLGGWTNPNIVDWYTDYARIVFNLFADRVKLWITINEPVIGCSLAFGIGILAPGLKDPEMAMYHCYKNQLLAHAKAWRIYDREFRNKYRGKVSIANQLVWFQPVSKEDEEITDLTHQYINGICSHPIYSDEGGWPADVEALIYEKSKMEGLSRSRLPPFTEEEIDLVRGTFDYYALNFYTSRLVRRALSGEVVPGLPLNGAPEIGAVFEADPGWESGASDWFRIYPEGLRKQLKWVKETCSDPEIMITENGLSTFKVGVDDQERARFYRNHLKQVLLAIQEDGVNVTAYSAWSLMDSFEWVDGYTLEFGLYSVDFQSPNKERTAKKSAMYYSNVIASRSLNVVPRWQARVSSAAERVLPSFSLVKIQKILNYLLFKL